MGVRFSRSRKLSKILAKNDDIKERNSTDCSQKSSTVGIALNQLQIELDLLKDVTTKPLETQTS